MHTCLHCGLICGIWDGQATTIVKDLNDSLDPKHMLFCRKNAFVVIYALFFRQHMSPFCPFRGGVRRKGTMSPFFTVFLMARLPLMSNIAKYYVSMLNIGKYCVSMLSGGMRTTQYQATQHGRNYD